MIFWCGIASLVLALSGFLSIIGVLLGFLTLAMASWPGPNPRTHRVRKRWARHRRIGQVCAWVSALLPFAVAAAIAIGMMYF